MSFLTIILVLHLALALPVCVHVLLTKRETSAPAWLALVLISPFLGAGLYWILGINRVERRARRLRGRRPAYVPQIRDPALPFAGLPTLQQRQMFHYETAVHDAPFLGGNDVTPLIGAEQVFPAMLEVIAAAKSSIALSVYIFQTDEVGRKFVDALRAAHARGVVVHVLIDEIGSGTGQQAADRPWPPTAFPPPGSFRINSSSCRW